MASSSTKGMSQEETFHWLVERSNRLEAVEADLAAERAEVRSLRLALQVAAGAAHKGRGHSPDFRKCENTVCRYNRAALATTPAAPKRCQYCGEPEGDGHLQSCSRPAAPCPATGYGDEYGNNALFCELSLGHEGPHYPTPADLAKEHLAAIAEEEGADE